MKYAYSYLLLTLFWPREDNIGIWYRVVQTYLRKKLVNIPKLTDLTKIVILEIIVKKLFGKLVGKYCELSIKKEKPLTVKHSKIEKEGEEVRFLANFKER